MTFAEWVKKPTLCFYLKSKTRKYEFKNIYKGGNL